MQNKGLVRFFGIALAIVCLFYLSFNVVTNIYESKANKISLAAKDDFQKLKAFASYKAVEKSAKLDSIGNKAYYNYLDSVANKKVYLGYTLKECREKGVNLGLDLKGGMNVTLEISVPDIIRAISNNNPSPTFNQALALATERQKAGSSKQYLDLFVQAYKEIDPQAKLSTIFSTFELKDRISLNSTNAEVIKVLRTEIDGAISNSFNVLRTRIDRFGVVQPNIQKLENSGRILIELPGIKEPERVRKLLQGSANLEFWETYELSEVYNNLIQANKMVATLGQQGTATAVKTVTDSTKTAQTPDVKKTEAKAAVNKIDSLKAALESKNVASTDSVKMREQFRKENPLFAILQLYVDANGQPGRGPVIGMAAASDTSLVNSYLNNKQVKELLPRDLGLRWSVKSVDEKELYYQLIAIKVTSRDGSAPLTGAVITDARDEFSQTTANAEVSMTMNAEGAKTWARMTKENIGRCIAIALDGYIYSYPTVNGEISGGVSQITGHFTVEEAKDLANVLKSGKMPAPARIVQEDVVGPSLGQDAVNNGLWSFIIAFLLVMIYMILYYGLIPGLIADLALFANVFFLMGILASFGAVLTLPGIAGIVLTLGMAVDGNVLIYERVREEKEAGKTQKKAVQEGLSHAMSAIIDANVTTLITGIILFIFGSGPILGFATTLIIGIVTSFITSVFLTRLMLETYVNRENAKDLAFTTKATSAFLQNTKLDFIGTRKIFYAVSGIVILICIAGLSFRGLSYGIDFTGGRNYIVQFEQKVNVEKVRSLLENTFEGSSVQAISIGTNNDKVRISTQYKIEENSETVDNEIDAKLYNSLKPLLNNTTTLDNFVKNNIVNSQKVGPTIAEDIKTSAIWAVILSLLGVSLYIFIRFNDFAFSMGTMFCLAHDTIIIIGAFALLWGIMPFSMEMDLNFIAAILTYIGFSVNDTVVIFDRIRENTGLYPKRDKKDVINEALNETLSRTFSTSASVLVVLFAIFVFGGDTIRGFIFALLIGSILGVYSTLYVAVPVAYDIMLNRKKKKALKAATTELNK